MKPYMLETKSDHTKIGSWLCTEGPYLDYISELSTSNPGLRKADPKNKDHPLRLGNAKVVLLELRADLGVDKREFVSVVDLESYFRKVRANDVSSRRRIYLVEGLAQDYISALGSHFFMDPSFFLRQERTCVWSNEFTPTSDALPQPSSLQPDKCFHIQYCELRQFDHALSNTPMYCQRTGRHIGMTPARIEEDSTTGILRRKCAFWSQKYEDGGWDAVILCDPQLQSLSINQTIRTDVNNYPFQGGYVDFIPPAPGPHPRPGSPQSEKSAPPTPRHPRHSMLRDLVFYFSHHGHLIPAPLWANPVTASLFMQKIVAAHYLQLVDYIKAALPSLEMRLSTGWTEEEEQWRSLQTISRRCGNYRDDVEDTLLSLGLGLGDRKSVV